jgi:hypothetical protein
MDRELPPIAAAIPMEGGVSRRRLLAVSQSSTLQNLSRHALHKNRWRAELRDAVTPGKIARPRFIATHPEDSPYLHPG